MALPSPIRFARTKIQPPRPRHEALIERPALESRLAQALGRHRLVLVCAAAGYGKTSAVARALQQCTAGTAVAWIAADEGDDLGRLLECLVAALEPYDPPWRSDPEALAQAASRGGRAEQRDIAALLINTLDACDAGHGIIVLDDLHRIEDPAVHAFLDLMLERLTARWTLAIASRVEPPLALARLRAEGELAEFGQADLAFDAGEVARLAAKAGHDAAAGPSLHARTHGWPAGVRLALNAPAGPGAARVDRHVFDFLATEVIAELPENLREFLLLTSVLPELNAANAAAVSGNPHSAALLEELERRGLFVTRLAEHEPTLRLHDLFRAALEQRLARDHSGRLPALLERAAGCQPDPRRRVAMLLAAGAFARAAETLAACGAEMITAGESLQVQQLIDRFPADIRERLADLQLVRAQLAWAAWDFDGMQQAAERAADAAAGAAQDDRGRLATGYRAIALGGQYRDDEAAAVADALLAGARLDDSATVCALTARGWAALERGEHAEVAPLLVAALDVAERSGRFDLLYQASPTPRYIGLPGIRPALERFAAMAQRYTPERPNPVRTLGLTTQAWLALWAGDVAGALGHLERAEDDARWLQAHTVSRGQFGLTSAFFAALAGDAPLADEALRRVRSLSEQTLSPRRRERMSGYAAAYQARLAAVLDDPAALQEALRPYAEGRVAADHPTAPASRAALVAHLAEIDRGPAAAIDAWRAALAAAERYALFGHDVELRLRLAAALLKAGRGDEAADEAALACRRVRPGENVGSALLAGQRVLRALAPLARGRRTAALAPIVDWAALAERLRAPAPPAAPAGGPAGTDLSPRELEVLERMAAGDSNKVIARSFDLSPHTVKRHVANVLGKLGVVSRGQAAAWYRQHLG